MFYCGLWYYFLVRSNTLLDTYTWYLHVLGILSKFIETAIYLKKNLRHGFLFAPLVFLEYLLSGRFWVYSVNVNKGSQALFLSTNHYQPKHKLRCE